MTSHAGRRPRRGSGTALKTAAAALAAVAILVPPAALPVRGAAAAPAAVAQSPAPASADEWTALGNRLLSEQRYAEALDALTHALALQRAAGDRAGQADTLYLMGYAKLRLDDAVGARDTLLASALLFNQLHDAAGEASTLLQLGRALFALNDYAPAVDALTRAQMLFQQTGNRRSEAYALQSLGHVYLAQGAYARVTDVWNRALAIFRDVQDRDGEANTLLFLGTLVTDFGDLRQAYALKKQALDLFRRPPENRDGEALALLSLGLTAKNMRQYPIAREMLSQAVDLFRQQRNPAYETVALAGLGETMLRLGQNDDARTDFEQALALARQYHLLALEIEMQISLGDVYYAKGQNAEALQSYTAAYQAAQRGADLKSLWWSAYGRVLSLRRLGRTQEAIDGYRTVIDVIERIRGGIDRSEQRVGFLGDKIEVYDGLTALLIQRASAPTAPDAVEAFNVAERGRARGMLDLMAEAQAGAAVDPQLLAQENALGTALAQVTAQQAAAAPNSPEAASLLRRRLDLEKQLQDVRQTLAARYPKYAELAHPAVVDAASAPRVLRPGEVLLEYFITGDVSAVWVVRPGRAVELRRLPAAAADVSALAARLRAQLADARAVPIANPQAPAAAAGFDVKVAHDLYRDLMEPVQADLAGAKTVFIVPHGPLLTLPFEALVEDAGAAPRYVGGTYAVAYVQSASLLALLRKEPRTPAAPRKPFLAFADPVYSPSESDARGMPMNRGADEIAAAERGAATGLAGVQLGRLPFTGDEARKIGELFGATEAGGDLYLRARAQETVVKQLSESGDLAKYRYVHFATHGLLGNEIPGARSEPALVLSLVGDPKDDGFLQMSEVLNLRLNADLVVLSACQTGLGEQVRGEGLIGLTRAFMYAGTPTVVVSLWSVSDPATAALMVEFYRGLKDGLSKGEALRRAKETLRTQGYRDGSGRLRSGASPYLWAPFILVGDPN